MRIAHLETVQSTFLHCTSAVKVQKAGSKSAYRVINMIAVCVQYKINVPYHCLLTCHLENAEEFVGFAWTHSHQQQLNSWHHGIQVWKTKQQQ